MKKVMFAAAVAAGMLAFGDAIESQNIVGYNQVTINKQYTILGIPFTGTTGAALSIQDAVPYCEGMTKGAAASGADSIQVMDDSGNYVDYFMCNGKSGKATVDGGDGKWVKSGEFAVTSDVIPAGKGAWFVRKSASLLNITIANPNAAN